MNFAKLIKSGYCITIEPDGIENKGFSPATFFYTNPYYGTLSPHANILRDDLNEPKVNAHIKSLIEERFKITIMQNAANPEVMRIISEMERRLKRCQK